MGILAFISLVSVVACAPPQAGMCTSPPAEGILAPARFLPTDVALFLHVEDAAALRRDLAQRPIARGLTTLIEGGAAATAWAALAREAQLSEAAIFDLCFGRSVAFASCNDGAWVVTTDLGERRARDLLARLHVRVREPQFGLAISELPEQEVLLACDGGRVVVGPVAQPQLFTNVLARMQGAMGNGSPALADDVDFRQGLPETLENLASADAALFIRHPRPLGGCSLIVADVCGDKVRVKHAARFENAPFLSPVTKLDCDFSPVRSFEHQALVAIMQPRDVGDGPVETFLSAGLGAGLLSSDLRRNLADRRLLIVGEQDGRQLPQPSDMLTTTFVACLEVKDPNAAVPQLDNQMARLAQRLNEVGDGSFLVSMPPVARMKSCERRHADLGAAEEWFSGGFPVMKTVSLNWAVADGRSGGGAWVVVGSNPQALQDAIESLQTPKPRDERFVGRFDSCGVVNGQRLGRHVQSWGAEAEEFTDPRQVAEVRSSLHMLGELAGGMEICRWQMSRPSADTMRLDVQLQLSPAESADHP